MDYEYSKLISQALAWAESAKSAGWIDQENVDSIRTLDANKPEDLFDSDSVKPLIVAFFGGTGVGKSSLLNRLAGSEIAKTGVERPTSREVTLFHHRDLHLVKMPQNLPLAGMQVAQHQDENQKGIIWIDMPDFDSTELSNKQLVFRWLPHIDILIYVVSPERYRDNKAWRLLQAEGGRHAWLFVINQWDRGESQQYEDFKKQLNSAGFNEPLIYKTICGEIQPDEFKQLSETIQSLASEQTIKHLKQRNIEIRLREIKLILEGWVTKLGTDQDFDLITTQWQQLWKNLEVELRKGFEWPIQQLARQYANQGAGANKANDELWDGWAQSRFEDTLDNIIILVDTQKIPIKPFKQALLTVRNKPAKIFTQQVELSVRQAMANPGNALHRYLLKFMFGCEVLLPLLAMSWVAYQVFSGYYHSSMTYRDYLGADFAIHSVLLIALSWLLPFFIYKKLTPSLERVAYKGLERGVLSALKLIEMEVFNAFSDIGNERKDRTEQIKLVLEKLKPTSKPEYDRYIDQHLQRMLLSN